MTTDLPSRARVVIVGGGVIGTSTAYHLTRLGWTDVLLLEQGSLSGGTTWHAAGLVGQLRASESGTRLVQYSGELYARLEAETGLSAGYKQCGGVIVARTEDRMTQLRRTAATADAFGLECSMMTPEEALSRWPAMRVDDLLGAIWLPGDGKANPTDLTMALAKGARQRGARVAERTRVLDVLVRDGAVTGVRTDRGDVEAEVVVNCAGQWARRSARWPASPCRCTPPSTSTSSPTRSRASTRTCRSCATRTAGPTSRRRSAAWWSAASSPRPSRGCRRTRCPTRSSSRCSTRTGTTSRS